jgi:beta-N-acetylhexosaminidase
VASALSLREKIARMLVFGFRGRDVADLAWVRHYLGDLGAGGVILFDRDQESGGARNVASPDQVRRLVADLRALAPGRELIVSIDQEGGVVTRLSPKWGFPAVASQAAIGEAGAAAVEAWAAGLVETLASVDINLNFAPVVDLDVNPKNPAIGALGRAFSADGAIVTEDARLDLKAHRGRRIRTALKHFPGLGSATVNTDFGVADVTATWTDAELAPYRAMIHEGLVDMVMAGHLVNGQLDPDAPASLSRKVVTDLLRNELGWGGVVVTDDMQAAAITEAFGADDAVALALEAGCDLLLFANQQVYDPERVLHVIDLVERLVGEGRLTEERIAASVDRLAGLFDRPPDLTG